MNAEIVILSEALAKNMLRGPVTPLIHLNGGTQDGG
jgi:hypothetical protein